MSVIRLLEPRLANQIAAGEVVERPASVVKEAVENSLDAGATRIDIDVEAGGTRLLRIRDNGAGIDEADMALSLARHATSKIDSIEDLEAVGSLGFRGEALASIASVSRLVLTSNTDEHSAQGQQALCEGREMAVSVRPAPHPRGTTLEVRDLFYNTPARRKFLRAEKTEFGHIHEVIKRQALSRPNVAFTLQHNGKQTLQLGAAERDSERNRRIATICGKEFAERVNQEEVWIMLAKAQLNAFAAANGCAGTPERSQLSYTSARWDDAYVIPSNVPHLQYSLRWSSNKAWLRSRTTDADKREERSLFKYASASAAKGRWLTVEATWYDGLLSVDFEGATPQTLTTPGLTATSSWRLAIGGRRYITEVIRIANVTLAGVAYSPSPPAPPSLPPMVPMLIGSAQQHIDLSDAGVVSVHGEATVVSASEVQLTAGTPSAVPKAVGWALFDLPLEQARARADAAGAGAVGPRVDGEHGLPARARAAA